MELQILLTGIIALCAVLSSLGFIFKILLSPVKEDVADLRIGQKALESGQKALESDISDLKTGQKELNSKLDQLLNK